MRCDIAVKSLCVGIVLTVGCTDAEQDDATLQDRANVSSSPESETQPHLTHRNARIEPVQAEYITHVAWDAGVYVLRRLGRSVELSEADGAYIAGLEGVRKVSIAGARIHPAVLSHLARMPTLEVLALQGCNVNDAGMKAVAQITGLRFLNVIDTNVGDVGLAELQRLEELEVLHVAGTRVTVEAIDRLKRSMPNLVVHR